MKSSRNYRKTSLRPLSRTSAASATRRFALFSLAGAIFLSAPLAEAGLFDKLKAKRRAKLKQAEVKAAPRKRIPRYRSYYHDAHKDAYINHELLDGYADDDTVERRVVIDIKAQRAYLIIQDLIAIDSAVSTARRGKYTPRGSYAITEKIKSGKVSTLYHVYMPNWMRLGHSAVGMHTGDLPGYPASAGCIRMPMSVAPVMFEHTRYGVEVDVVDSWDEEGLLVPYSRPDTIWLADVSAF